MRWIQYLLLEKSPSRRCMTACQKQPVGFSRLCEITCDSSRKSCHSHKPDTMAAAPSRSLTDRFNTVSGFRVARIWRASSAPPASGTSAVYAVVGRRRSASRAVCDRMSSRAKPASSCRGGSPPESSWLAAATGKLTFIATILAANPLGVPTLAHFLHCWVSVHREESRNRFFHEGERHGPQVLNGFGRCVGDFARRLQLERVF